MYTKQQTYDLVVKHLLEQGVPSLNPLGQRCRYRQLEGSKMLKCAAGFLIPDDKYAPTFEGVSVYDLRVSSLVMSLGHNLDLVGDLQQAHDGASSAREFLPALRLSLVGIAKSHALSTAVLDT